jgi:hypothetical protein
MMPTVIRTPRIDWLLCRRGQVGDRHAGTGVRDSGWFRGAAGSRACLCLSLYGDHLIPGMEGGHPEPLPSGPRPLGNFSRTNKAIPCALAICLVTFLSGSAFAEAIGSQLSAPEKTRSLAHAQVS